MEDRQDLPDLQGTKEEPQVNQPSGFRKEVTDMDIAEIEWPMSQEDCDHTLSQICIPVGDDVGWICGSCGSELDIDV